MASRTRDTYIWFRRLGTALPAAFTMCLCVLSAVSMSAQDTTGVGSVTGIVVADGQKPASQVTVCIAGTTQCVLTDAGGRFRLAGLRAGPYRLQVTPAGQPAELSTEFEVHAGVTLSIEFSLPPLTPIKQTVTVTATAQSLPAEIKTSGVLVPPEAIQDSAGSLQDVSRYLQSLPGVVTGSEEERNDLIVRGGSPLENLFIIDNIEVPNINSFANFASGGGLVGILDPTLLRDVTFLTGGYPASFSNRLSSVLQIGLREGDREQFRGTLNMGFAGAGVVLEGPIKRSKGSWVISARRTFLDLFTNDIGPGGVPVSYYLNSKAIYDLTPRDRIWALNLTDIDSIDIGLHGRSLNDPTVIKEDIEQDIFSRSSRISTGVNWQHIFGDHAVGLLGTSYSQSRPDFTVRDLLKPGTPIMYIDHSREGEATVKYDLTVDKIPFFGRVQAGGIVHRFDLNYVVSAPIGLDNAYSATPNVNSFVLNSAFSALQPGAYFQMTRELSSRLNVTLGGRFDDYDYIGKSRLSPRVALTYSLPHHLVWSGSYGRYFQQAPFLFLSAFPQNRNLLPLSATHFVTGFAYTPNANSQFTVELYRKNYHDYPVSAQFPTLSLANLGDTFDEAQSLMPLLSAGHGLAEGIEFFASHRTASWNAQASVAWSRAWQAGLDNILRPSSFDSPVVVNLLAGRRFFKNWAASGRFTFRSGRPYTPFNASLSEQGGYGIFDLTQVDGIRTPSYLRLDLRIDRTWTVHDKPLTVFFDVQNLTNRQNLLIYTWNRITNRQTALNQEGLFPIVGFEWRFH